MVTNASGWPEIPFLCEPVIKTHFKSLKNVHSWVCDNEDRIERECIIDLIEKGVLFSTMDISGGEKHL